LEEEHWVALIFPGATKKYSRVFGSQDLRGFSGLKIRREIFESMYADTCTQRGRELDHFRGVLDPVLISSNPGCENVVLALKTWELLKTNTIGFAKALVAGIALK